MDEECVAVGGVAEVGLEGGQVFVCCEVVGGVAVARGVRHSLNAGGGADGSGLAHPVGRADGFVWLMGAGGCEPCDQVGLHLDVAHLLGLGDGCGDVDVAVSDVAPGEAGELFGTDPGEKEQGEG